MAALHRVKTHPLPHGRGSPGQCRGSRARRAGRVECTRARLRPTTRTMNVRIGTAGYAYRAWVGGFYPPRTSQHDMLPYYARHFPAVEINSSFYRPPSREQVARMARRTPPGFAFTLK